MVGKVGMTPAFKGYIIVPLKTYNHSDELTLKNLNTKNISTIKKEDSGYTRIETSNYGTLFVPQRFAPTHNIVTAYAAAKEDSVTVDTRA